MGTKGAAVTEHTAGAEGGERDTYGLAPGEWWRGAERDGRHTAAGRERRKEKEYVIYLRERREKKHR